MDKKFFDEYQYKDSFIRTKIGYCRDEETRLNPWR